MASVAELPGEANPLNRQNLFNALVAAAGTTQQQVLTGGQQLQNWEKHEGYYALLQDIFVDYSLPVEVRYLSIIQLKNGIDKYWRKTASNALKPEEKTRIKTRALEAGIVEPVSHLALHNALVISKILRHEFPMDWPDAIATLLGLLRSSLQPGSNPLQLPRILLILLQVIKELATGRLQRTRKGLESAAPELFHVLASIYVQKVQKWGSFLESGGDDEAGALDASEQSLISLKVLRRLVIAGFENPNRDPEIPQFWSLTLSHFGNFYSLLKREPSNLHPRVQKLIEKHILQLSKLHLTMAQSRPLAFALLPHSLDLVRSYWGLVVELGKSYGSTDLTTAKIGTDGDADEEEKPLLEKLGLKALLIVRACAKTAFYPVQTLKYPHPQDKEEKAQSIHLLKSQLFTEDFVVHVMELLVTRFFVFRSSDLREWEEEPEEWEKREEEISDAWEFSIRSCAEKLYLDLVINFKELLIPKLLHVFCLYANPQNQEVLLKDSLYCAIGLAAACLDNHLDFNSFLISTLVPEIQIQRPGYNILRRRTSILLGQWVPVKPNELDRAAVYQIFQHLLNKDDPLNDQVVRVTAGRQLKSVLDPFEFTAEGFLPYSTPILQSLMNLIQEVELTETKMALLETVRVAVVKLEDHISPFADQIMSLLPPLWEQSGEQHLMKQAILTLITSLIHSMKQESIRYHSLIIPLIQNSVEPESEALVYLLEESLELWSAILIQTPAPGPAPLLALFPSLLPIFEVGTDCARQALEITQSYIMLAPQEFANDNIRFRLLASLEPLIGPNVRCGIGLVPHIAEKLVRVGESVDNGSEQIYTAIAKSFVDSSFLQNILAGLREAHQAHLTTGPRKKSPAVYGVTETDYFSILARFALASPRVFFSAVTSATGSTPEAETMSWLLTEWFSHFDNIGDINRKKLHALGLTKLLSVNGISAPPPPFLLDHLQSYLTVWTDLITELAEGTEDEPAKQGDYLVHWENEPGDAKYHENEPPGTTRERLWSVSDPVRKLNIRQFVTEHIRGVVAACGGIESFKENWLVNVDQDVVNGFGQLGVF
ncbi:hypothetical protein VTO42DRAFT_6880 [Malbranchea cinnamomea]